jgi:methionyl-tRNA formyltransferase
MLKKVLIISDNIFLCKKLNCLFFNYKKKYDFTFSTSPYSSSVDFNNELNEEVIVFNLKENNDIKFITMNYNLVLSIHCKQLFPKELFGNIKCINIHPGYNPINRGWYPQVFAIANNLPTGATIHEIDEKIDHGNIIARSFVNVEIFDTSKTLYDKILSKEIELVRDNLDTILNESYDTFLPEEEGQVYLKKDFRQLCELNLNESATTFQIINKLRALSHGSFENAYFIDPESGKKIYVSIDLKPEK